MYGCLLYWFITNAEEKAATSGAMAKVFILDYFTRSGNIIFYYYEFLFIYSLFIREQDSLYQKLHLRVITNIGIGLYERRKL